MKQKAGKRVLAAVLGSMMVLGLSGCGQDTTSPVSEAASEVKEEGGYTINYMMGQSRFKENAHNQIKDLMQEKYNITVEYEIIPDSQSINLLQTKLATGEAPDVVDLNIPGQYTTYDAKSNFVPLDDQPWVQRLSMDPSGLKADDGKIYGMPITGFSGVMGVIYSKQVFADLGLEIPTTYEAFLGTLDTIKTSGKDIAPLYISGKDTWTIQITPMIFLANALDANAQASYDKVLHNELKFSEIPEYRKVMEDFQALFEKEYTNKDYAVATYDNSKEALATGKAAMIVSGEFAVNDINSKWPEAEIGMFPIPYNDVDKVLTANYVVGASIPTSCSNVENAKEFLNLLSQPEFLEIYLNDNPLNSPFTDVKSEKLNPVPKEMYEKYLNQGKMVPQVSDMLSNFGSLNEDVIMPVYVQLAQGGSIDDALEQIDAGCLEYGKNLGLPEYQ